MQGAADGRRALQEVAMDIVRKAELRTLRIASIHNELIAERLQAWAPMVGDLAKAQQMLKYVSLLRSDALALEKLIHMLLQERLG